MGFKFCSSCNKDKPNTEFRPNKKLSTGLMSYCRNCCSVRSFNSSRKKAIAAGLIAPRTIGDSPKLGRKPKVAASIKPIPYEQMPAKINSFWFAIPQYDTAPDPSADYTWSEIADRLGISPAQVRKSFISGMEKLYVGLIAKGITPADVFGFSEFIEPNLHSLNGRKV